MGEFKKNCNFSKFSELKMYLIAEQQDSAINLVIAALQWPLHRDNLALVAPQLTQLRLPQAGAVTQQKH